MIISVVMFYEIHTKGQWRSSFIGIILTVLITFGAIYIIHDNIKYSEGYHSSKKKLSKD